jgi:lysophospholipase L1-like esterase
MSKHYHTYLALGDSYTIGEGVPLHDSFPYQAVQKLRKNGHHFNAAEIVAKTGWTTFELAEHILHSKLNDRYDFVTLLIGVNNQYRNLLAKNYKDDFEFLLKKAIHFTGEHADKVIVLSIPDWGVTPFAKGRDSKKIESAIDEFNVINREISGRYGAAYIDITSASRKGIDDESLLADDKLHYSAKLYGMWANDVVALIEKMIHK